jgi:hypothetical protein
LYWHITHKVDERLIKSQITKQGQKIENRGTGRNSKENSNFDEITRSERTMEVESVSLYKICRHAPLLK